MRIVYCVFATLLLFLTPASAATTRMLDLASPDSVLRWINAYRDKPDPAGVPAAVKALSGFGNFKDPEQAGVYTGFIAGIIAANPRSAEHLISKMLPLPPGDQWIIVRAIAYSENPEWRTLLRKFENRLPDRTVMIDKYLDGSLPRLFQVDVEKPPTTWDTVRDYVTFEKFSKKQPEKPHELEPSPELLDTFWGYYFATGTARPIARIMEMLPWSKNKDNLDKLTLGSMAKYTLASNAARDPELLALIKRGLDRRPKEIASVLKEVIEAAETVQVADLRREAMSAIDDLRRKGPDYKRNVSWWGQIGTGALAVGCIAAAATGQIELGLPCVITGGVSSAALTFWEKQQ
jgi:hypothetical protein